MKFKVSRTFKLIAFGISAAIAMAFDAVALVFLTRPHSAVSWVFYGLAIGFSVAVVTAYLVFKKQLHTAAREKLFSGEFFERLKRNKFVQKILGDYNIRTLVTTFTTLVWSAFYTFYLVMMAAVYESTWYASLAGFYATLVLMRGGIVLASRIVVKRYGYLPSKISKIIYSFTGGVFIILGGVIVAPVIQASIGTYPPGEGSIFELVINLIPAIIKMTSAVILFVRSTRKRSYVAMSIRNIGLVSATMSLMLLDVVIIRRFGHSDTIWQSLAAFGGVFSGLTIIAGVVMMFIGIRSIKKSNAIENVIAEPRPELFPLLPGKEDDSEQFDAEALKELSDLDKPFKNYSAIFPDRRSVTPDRQADNGDVPTTDTASCDSRDSRGSCGNSDDPGIPTNINDDKDVLK